MITVIVRYNVRFAHGYVGKTRMVKDSGHGFFEPVQFWIDGGIAYASNYGPIYGPTAIGVSGRRRNDRRAFRAHRWCRYRLNPTHQNKQAC